MSNKKVVGGVIIAVVFMFLTSIAACGGLFYSIYQNTNNQFSPIVDEIFVAVADGEFDEIYENRTSPEFQQSVTNDHFAGICGQYQKLGPLKSKTMTSFNVNYNNGQQLADVSYSAEFAKGAATITTKFRQVEDEWKLVSIYIDSDYFTESPATFTCSECQGDVGRNDDSCPQCGTIFREPAA
ncbi:MAG: hypothetical protein ACI9G1_005050 [Pirellulaceae bacterium]|jgi:hypothetical protein